MASIWDALKQYINDAKPGGLLNREMTPDMATDIGKGLLSFTPGVGDAISGYDAVQSARQGNYGEAALNGMGLLPFVPSMGGSITRVSPEIIKALGSDEPAVLASKVKGLLTTQIQQQRSLAERLARSDISDADKFVFNTKLVNSDSNVKKLYEWLTELEPPINQAKSF